MDWQAFLEPGLWQRMGLCIFCGLIVGIERQAHKKPIDIRTSVLVCLGTMLFIYLGDLMEGEKDNTRVLGQVATGIGFLGAGAIITRHGLVIGLTSASVVWVLAAIGAAIGLGFYEIGVTVSIVTAALLMCLQWVENLTDRWASKEAPPSP